MGLSRRLAQSPPSLRWHRSRVVTRVVYKRAFAQVGRGTVIVSPARLRGVERIRIGGDCSIYEGAWLACEPGGGPLTIGDRNYFGHQVHVHALDPVTIGNDCVLADGVFIGSSDHDRIDRHAVHGTGPIIIGDRVFLGQRAVVLGGVTIDDGVRPGATVGGVPARELGGS